MCFSKSENQQNVSFDDKIVCYLDVLGFSNMTINYRLKKDLWEKILNKVLSCCKNNKLFGNFKSLETIISFSDSIVISGSAKTQQNIKDFLIDISSFIGQISASSLSINSNLLSIGSESFKIDPNKIRNLDDEILKFPTLFRGGITIGYAEPFVQPSFSVYFPKIINSQLNIAGKGYTNAVKIAEQTKMNGARVLIDKNVVSNTLANDPDIKIIPSVIDGVLYYDLIWFDDNDTLLLLLALYDFYYDKGNLRVCEIYYETILIYVRFVKQHSKLSTIQSNTFIYNHPLFKYIVQGC